MLPRDLGARKIQISLLPFIASLSEVSQLAIVAEWRILDK